MNSMDTSITGTAQTTVTSDKLAVNVCSGNLEVYATPCMIALMEQAACDCLAEYLENDETTVGTELNVRHTSATPEGMAVRAEAELTEVDGRQFTFTVKAFDEAGLIGEGTHKRFLVYGGRFTEKAKSKIG